MSDHIERRAAIARRHGLNPGESVFVDNLVQIARHRQLNACDYWPYSVSKFAPIVASESANHGAESLR